MRTLIISTLFITAIFACCNSNNKDTDSNSEGSQTPNTTAATSNTESKNASVNDVITAYISLKNALANDNSQGAADAGNQMYEALNNINKSTLADDKAKVYDEVADDAKEHAEHISKNNGNIKHQREHFDMLSKDMYDLVKALGAEQTLYQDHCPMYNDNKGATWLSETKDIKNPYLGQEMPTCGEVKEEIKP